LAAQLLVVYEARQECGELELGHQGRTPESARSLVERLREAGRSIDWVAAAERVAGLQQEHFVGERQRVQEANASANGKGAGMSAT